MLPLQQAEPPQQLKLPIAAAEMSFSRTPTPVVMRIRQPINTAATRRILLRGVRSDSHAEAVLSRDQSLRQ